MKKLTFKLLTGYISKTNQWDIIKQENLVGKIGWDYGSNQYALYPSANTIWGKEDLFHVFDFIKKEIKNYKETNPE
jgi:hypothetical protein